MQVWSFEDTLSLEGYRTVKERLKTVTYNRIGISAACCYALHEKDMRINVNE